VIPSPCLKAPSLDYPINLLPSQYARRGHHPRALLSGYLTLPPWGCLDTPGATQAPVWSRSPRPGYLPCTPIARIVLTDKPLACTISRVWRTAVDPYPHRPGHGGPPLTAPYGPGPMYAH